MVLQILKSSVSGLQQTRGCTFVRTEMTELEQAQKPCDQQISGFGRFNFLVQPKPSLKNVKWKLDPSHFDALYFSYCIFLVLNFSKTAKVFFNMSLICYSVRI